MEVKRVTFAANLLGDVLCSFVRPIKDTVYTVCYLGRAVPLQLARVQLAAQLCNRNPDFTESGRRPSAVAS